MDEVEDTEDDVGFNLVVELVLVDVVDVVEVVEVVEAVDGVEVLVVDVVVPCAVEEPAADVVEDLVAQVFTIELPDMVPEFLTTPPH